MYLILAGLWIVHKLILWRQLERLLDALQQVAPDHRDHDVDVMNQKQRLI
jgi:hypothetical protein